MMALYLSFRAEARCDRCNPAPFTAASLHAANLFFGAERGTANVLGIDLNSEAFAAVLWHL